MTEKYDSYENSIAERVNGILKQEFDISNRRLTKVEAINNINRVFTFITMKGHTLVVR